jgi:hypothetical protein
MVAALANAADLTQWANRLDAQGLLPKLIRRLILATAGLVHFRSIRPIKWLNCVIAL